MAEIARYARFQVVVFGGGKEKPRSRETAAAENRAYRTISATHESTGGEAPSNDPPPARLQPAGEPSPAGPQATRRQPAAVPNATPQATRHQRPAPPREESVSLARTFERRAPVGVSCVRQERRRHRAPVLQITPSRPRSTHGITRVPPPRRRRRPAPHRHAARAVALPLRHAVDDVLRGAGLRRRAQRPHRPLHRGARGRAVERRVLPGLEDLPGTRGLAGGFGRVRCRVRAQHRQRGTTARVLHEVPGAARPRGQYLRRPAHRSTVVPGERGG